MRSQFTLLILFLFLSVHGSASEGTTDRPNRVLVLFDGRFDPQTGEAELDQFNLSAAAALAKLGSPIERIEYNRDDNYVVFLIAKPLTNSDQNTFALRVQFSSFQNAKRFKELMENESMGFVSILRERRDSIAVRAVRTILWLNPPKEKSYSSSASMSSVNGIVMPVYKIDGESILDNKFVHNLNSGMPLVTDAMTWPRSIFPPRNTDGTASQTLDCQSNLRENDVR